MTTSVPIQAELQRALALMTMYLGVFARHGFKLVETAVVQAEDVADSIEFSFRNYDGGREFLLSYFPARDEDVRMFVASLTNESGDYFILDDYLSKHGRTDLEERLMDSRDNSDIEQFWARVFGALDELFSTDPNFQQILSGERWEDIPQDFQGYK
jgi:hypothetical protein